jgi:hypothetical protein
MQFRDKSTSIYTFKVITETFTTSDQKDHELRSNTTIPDLYIYIIILCVQVYKLP